MQNDLSSGHSTRFEPFCWRHASVEGDVLTHEPYRGKLNLHYFMNLVIVSCLCHAGVMLMLWWCHADVMLLSCLCHALPCWCHASIILVSCCCRADVVLMSCRHAGLQWLPHADDDQDEWQGLQGGDPQGVQTLWRRRDGQDLLQEPQEGRQGARREPHRWGTPGRLQLSQKTEDFFKCSYIRNVHIFFPRLFRLALNFSLLIKSLAPMGYLPSSH